MRSMGTLGLGLVVIAVALAGCTSPAAEPVEPAADDPAPGAGTGSAAPRDEPSQPQPSPPASGGNATGGAAANASAAPAAPAAPPEVALEVRVTGLYPVNPGFAAEPGEVPAGALVSLTYRNEDLNPLGKHDWLLEGVAASQTDLLDAGEVAEVQFLAPAEPGTYAYYCTVEGHRDRGMEGALTVA